MKIADSTLIVVALFGLVALVGMTIVAADDGAFESGARPGVQFTAQDPPPARSGSDQSIDKRPSVIGTDDRIEILETDQYPWSAIAYLELYDDFGNLVGHCTGTFIGPDALLTAGHCLWNAADGWTAQIAVVPGKSGASEPFGYAWADSWWVPDPWIDGGELSEWDWGVIRLEDSALGDVTGSYFVANLTTSTLEEPELAPAIVGYPGDKPDGTMWGSLAQRFLFVDDFLLYFDIDTYFGQSGSAIFSTRDGPHLGAIVGVLTEGNDEANRGTRIDRVFLDDILYACELMGCTIINYTEPIAAPSPQPTTPPPPTPTAAPLPRHRRPIQSLLTRATTSSCLALPGHLPLRQRSRPRSRRHRQPRPLQRRSYPHRRPRARLLCRVRLPRRQFRFRRLPLPRRASPTGVLRSLSFGHGMTR